MNYKEKKEYIRKLEIKLERKKGEKDGFEQIEIDLNKERSGLMSIVSDMTKSKSEVKEATERLTEIRDELVKNAEKVKRRVKEIGLLKTDLERAENY